MAAITKEGSDYEYDIALEINVDHVAVVTKTRCAKLDGKVFKKPGEDFAEIIKEWLGSGAAVVEKAPERPRAVETPAPQSEEELSIIDALRTIFLSKPTNTEEGWQELLSQKINAKPLADKKALLSNWMKKADQAPAGEAAAA